MYQNFQEIVSNCLNTYHGGDIFFDAIDQEIRINQKLLLQMLEKIKELEYDAIIVSGSFGKTWEKFYYQTVHSNSTNFKDLFIVNGSLREGQIQENNINIDTIKGKKFIFIDDSFYLGRTRDKIKAFIEKYQGIFLETYVFYDGSIKKEKKVHSFYRYYDHFSN